MTQGNEDVYVAGLCALLVIFSAIPFFGKAALYLAMFIFAIAWINVYQQTGKTVSNY